MPSPPGGLDAGEHGQGVSAADDYIRDDGSAVAQGHLDKVVAAEAPKLVGVAIQGECAFNAFRQDAQKLIGGEDAGGVFTAGEHAAEFGDDAGHGPEFEQSGMDEKAGNASGLAMDDVQGHDCVPGHESAMVADQDRAAFAGKVLHAVGFDAPIVLGEKIEEMPAGVDEVKVGAGILQR